MPEALSIFVTALEPGGACFDQRHAVDSMAMEAGQRKPGKSCGSSQACHNHGSTRQGGVIQAAGGLTYLALQAKKQLETLKSQIEPSKNDKIESLITNLEEAVQKEDYTSMQKYKIELQAELMEVGQSMYAQEEVDGSVNTDAVETDFSTEK